jgi:hypothetical protein
MRYRFSFYQSNFTLILNQTTMNIVEFSKKLALTRGNGWIHTDLNATIKSTFYKYAIGLEEFNLLWCAFVPPKDFAGIDNHHFNRDESLKNEYNPYRPLLLLVTDGRIWYASVPGQTSFKKTTLKNLRKYLFGAIGQFKKMLPKEKAFIPLQKNLLMTMFDISRMLKPDTVSIHNSDSAIDPSCGSGGLFLSEAAVMQPTEHSTLQEKIDEGNPISSGESPDKNPQSEAEQYKKMMHMYLRRSFRRKLLERLLNFRNTFIYVHPWFNRSQLLVKIADRDLSVLAPGEVPKVYYFHIEDSAHAYPIDITSNDIEFFRFYPDLLKDLMDEF